MIGHLTGILASKAPDGCVIDVGGVGYSVRVSLTTFEKLPDAGEKVSLTIHTHVREDQLVLYGFASPEERALFQRLINVSGIGPKTALSMLSGLPVNSLIEAICTKDMARLSTVPGVGKRTAERIIVELQDKLETVAAGGAAHAATPKTKVYDDVVSALTNLGYKRQQAEATLGKIEWSDEMAIEGIIRAALKELCRV